MTKVDVAVVGAGPVGATLAALLARAGLSVRVFERDTDVYPLPRAAHLDAETLRTLRQIGAWSDQPDWSIVNEGMDFLTADKQLLIRMTAQPDDDHTAPTSNLFHQPSLDRLLRQRAAALGATILLGHEVVSIEESTDGVVLTAIDQAGETVSVEAEWVVGCCGARSFTRRFLGTGQIDLDFDEPWLVVDVVLKNPDPNPPRRTIQVCDPARPHTIVPMPWPRRRFEFMLLPGEEPDEINRPEMIGDLMSPYLPVGTADVERSAVYTFHGLITKEWRRGRVLVAGDAAHQMPPFLGQGMCSGVRDALNLAWKLVAVVSGADDSLLDTYQPERAPHVQSIVESAVGFGRVICTLDAEEAAGRDAMMLAARAENPTDIGGTAMPRLGGSALTTDTGGYVVSDGRLDGTIFDEVLDGRWCVVVREPDCIDESERTLVESLGGIVLVARDGTVTGRILDNAETDVVVVRPDRIVLGTGRAALAVLDDAAVKFALV
jgi:3-(3-hydroxy-phenyl)propionate hydroxylase